MIAGPVHPVDCPNWEYRDLPGFEPILVANIAQVLTELRSGTFDVPAFIVDSRPTHARIYSGLVSSPCLYYAGHYRGEAFRCLQYANVRVGNMYGQVPDRVGVSMKALGLRMSAGLAEVDAYRKRTDVTEPQKLLKSVHLSCEYLSAFLRIHPYANGNGHIGRLGVWAILEHFGYRLNDWPVEPRPQEPQYTDMLVEYQQRSNPTPLVRHILSCIAGRSGGATP